MKNTRKTVETVLGVLVGNVLVALAVGAFVVPHGIIMGGATGIALTISHYVPVTLSVMVLLVNGVLFLAGAATLGKKFVFTTIASTFLYPVCLTAVQQIPGITTLTNNIMLATLYGGAILGVGIGMIIRVGASTGGSDIIALVASKYTHITVAYLLYAVDFIILSAQITFSGAEQIMYGIILLFLETFVMNRMMVMGQSQIQLFVISDEYEEIRRKMLLDNDAGVTMVQIETGYGKEEQKGVLCIIPKRKLYYAKESIQEVDPKAFITISQINEVKGRGFTMERIRYQEENQ